MARSSTSGQGRPKGTPNKITRDLREMILGALDDAGGRSYLKAQAKLNPSAFLQLVGKVLPTELKGTGVAPIIVVERSYGGGE